MQLGSGKTSMLHIKCVVHRAQAIMKHASEVMPELVSGVLSVALSMRATGALSVFRRILKEVITERLRVYHSEPPLAVRQRTFALLRMFSHRGGRRGRQVAVLLTLLANGDWNCQHEVQHFCAGPWCCKDHADTLGKFCKFVVPALAGVMFVLFAKSRWQGGHRAVDQQAVFASTHGLLGVAYERWASLQDKMDRSRDPQPLLPVEDAPLGGSEADPRE